MCECTQSSVNTLHWYHAWHDQNHTAQTMFPKLWELNVLAQYALCMVLCFIFGCKKFANSLVCQSRCLTTTTNTQKTRAKRAHEWEWSGRGKKFWLVVLGTACMHMIFWWLDFWTFFPSFFFCLEWKCTYSIRSKYVGCDNGAVKFHLHIPKFSNGFHGFVVLRFLHFGGFVPLCSFIC